MNTISEQLFSPFSFGGQESDPDWIRGLYEGREAEDTESDSSDVGMVLHAQSTSGIPSFL